MNQDEKNEFKKILESGATVDDLFVEKPYTSSDFKLDHNNDDDDSFITIQKKYLASEEMLKLINKEISFSKLLSEVLAISMNLIRCEAASILEIDYDNSCYFFRAAAGKGSDALLKVTVPAGKGIVGYVCENQTAVQLSQTKDASIHLKSIGLIVGFEAFDVLAVPIVIDGKTFACIELLNPTTSQTFKRSDVEVLEAIASYSSVVIKDRFIKAKLYEKAYPSGVQKKKVA